MIAILNYHILYKHLSERYQIFQQDAMISGKKTRLIFMCVIEAIKIIPSKLEDIMNKSRQNLSVQKNASSYINSPHCVEWLIMGRQGHSIVRKMLK